MPRIISILSQIRPAKWPRDRKRNTTFVFIINATKIPARRVLFPAAGNEWETVGRQTHARPPPSPGMINFPERRRNPMETLAPAYFMHALTLLAAWNLISNGFHYAFRILALS